MHVLNPYHGIQRGWDSADAALAYLEETIQLEGANTIAGFILEPVVGTNGILVPPDGYLQGVRALCDKYGIVMIADEVMAGFGRTGKWFSVDHWNVVPDIITMAKGLTSAYVQLGAVGLRRKIADHFRDNVFYGGLTYNSHTLACAAALATIAVYEEDDLIERAHRDGRADEGPARRSGKAPSVGRRRAIDRPVRDRRARAQSQDDGADGAVQRHVARDAGAGTLLPDRGALHVRAVEHVLHQSAAVHHRSGDAREHSRSSIAGWRTQIARSR